MQNTRQHGSPRRAVARGTESTGWPAARGTYAPSRDPLRPVRLPAARVTYTMDTMKASRPWLAILLAACLAPSCAESQALPRAPEAPAAVQAAAVAVDRPLAIHPAAEGWEAAAPDVEKVLRSSADALWVYFPERQLRPILVDPKGGPIVLFGRGPNGEYRVRLNTGKTYWAQYAFQFAHEFCHILCDYKADDESNKWFEESVCETASLFALRRMSQTWRAAPPYPNWKDFAPHLASYAAERMREVRLPADLTLAAWYHQNEAELRKNPCLRDKNRVVAGELLPLFEKAPEHWESVAWLNAVTPGKPRSLEQYLADWHERCPPRHKAFVRQIAERFGIRLEAT